jgi:Holliday junction resolvase RusA-like endonuclease
MIDGYRIYLDIEPMGAVRTTQKQMFSDKRYKKYKTWKDDIVILWNAELIKLGFKPEEFKFDEIKSIDFVITIPISETLSKKVKQEREDRIGRPHQMKPDIDNMLKAFMDALMKEDSHVHTIGRTRKVWGTHGHIVVVI